MPKRLFICELCGEEFADWDECWAHEDAHIKPDVYGISPMNYLPLKNKDCDCRGEVPQPYPLDIRVPMRDGAIVQYTFDRVIIPVPPVENSDNIPSCVQEATNE